MPRYQDIHWEGLTYDSETFFSLMSVNREQAGADTRSLEELFDLFYDRLPKEFVHLRELQKSRLWRSPQKWELARQIF